MAIDDKLVQRINELAKKKKAQGLNNEEQKEQKELREQYLKAFRGNFKSVLNNVDVVDKLELDIINYKIKEVNTKLEDIAAIRSIKEVEDKIEILYDYKKIQEKEILEKIK